MKTRKILIPTLILIAFIFSAAGPYPIDGYEESGIRRLRYLQLVMEGSIKDTKPISGARLSISDIKLNLVNEHNLEGIPNSDAALQKSISGLFAGLDPQYSVSVLDISPGKEIRYASRKEKSQYQPGSVGKLCVMAGFFTEIQKIYPQSFAKRQELMRSRKVMAGKWAMTDSHTVPFFDPETKTFKKRTLIESDVFSLYEWLDHMLSVSNNGAASVVWRETILMRAFGKDYPSLTQAQADEYFKSTPKATLSELANQVVNQPLRKLDISEDEWRLGALFTRGAGSYIPGKGGSTGTTQGVMKFLIKMESGQIVDGESSLEMKRLMYMTDRRIRYGTAAALADAAVYFKSGSLYQCREEEGYSCGKYKGNVTNYMNSVAIIEHQDGSKYMVVLMSNVLKKNSASDHASLAASIDKIIRK
tara:strand:- start:16516 stop:17769 length:1254 start_codon:yes stop_codon:yes gene_type:complete